MAPPDEQRQPVVRPGPDEPASYEQHVKTFLRKKDRNSVKRAFDRGPSGWSSSRSCAGLATRYWRIARLSDGSGFSPGFAA